MAHYLLAASPVPGHVLPLLRIGLDLRDRGHEVRFLTGEEFQSIVHDAGLRGEVLPPETEVRPPSRGNPVFSKAPDLIRRWHRGRTEMSSLFAAPLAAQYRALQTVLAECERVDAVLVDVAFTGALPLLIGDAPRPPVLVCGVSPLTVSSLDTPPFGPGWVPQPRVNYSTMTWVVHHVLFGSTQRRLNRALRGVHSRRSPVFLTDWPRLADRLVQLTVPGFEYPRRDLPANVVFTGPIFAGHVVREHLPAWWPDLLTARRVVHVTQGTWDNTDLDLLVGATLRALAHRDDVLVVVTTGGAPRDTLGDPLPANARVSDMLPYSALLPHVDAMVTNGGYGGVQNALSFGVPLVVAGDTADKPEVAQADPWKGNSHGRPWIGSGAHGPYRPPCASTIAAASRHPTPAPRCSDRSDPPVFASTVRAGLQSCRGRCRPRR